MTQAEVDAYNNVKTNKPAVVETPTNQELVDKTKTADDIKVQMPSGIDQDLEQANKDIASAQEDVAKYTTEVSMKTKIVTYYYNIISNYENEVKFTTGPMYSQPWDLSQVSEAKNVHKNASSHYYPQGYQTDPIQVLAADSPSNATQTYTTNLIATLTTANASIQDFKTSYSNAVRTNDSFSPKTQSTTTTNPDPPPATITTESEHPDYTTYKTKKAKVLTDVTKVTQSLQNIKSLLEISPYPDDKEPTAATRATARLAEVADQLTKFTTIKNASYYPDSILNNATSSDINTFKTQATSRVAEINTTTQFKKPDYYTIRKSVALSLVTMADGLIYKKLAAEQAVIDFTKKRDLLQIERDAYHSSAMTDPTT